MSQNLPACNVEGLLNDRDASCVESHAAGLIPVVYEIHLDTALSLPYAIHWDGRDQPSGRVARTRRGQVATIRLLARSTQTVGLYLGSDASPEHRREMLYPVVVGPNDIHVVIRSTPGRVSAPAQVGNPVRRNQPTPHGDKRDEYEAKLTGETWQQFSHPYSTAEARAIAAATGEADVLLLQTLDTIYAGRVNPTQGLLGRFDNQAPCQIAFQAGADANCTANIAGYQSATDFGAKTLPRVHPHAWLALLQAARDTKVSSLTLTSTWRPMTGQSPHRLGLGMDVKDVRDAKGREAVFDVNNKKLYGSEQERLDHAAWKAAEVRLDKANLDLIAAEKAAKKVNTPQALAAEQQARTAQGQAETARDKARKDFQTKYASGLSWSFQDALLKNLTCVTQLFDPIRMDENTQDKEDPRANTQRSANEKTHNNHLHVTARDAYLIP